MNLMLFRHLWGVDAPMGQAFEQFREFGYAGVESRMPPPEETPRFRDLLNAHRFAYIPQIFSEGKTVEEHLSSFRAQIVAAKTFRPWMINAHSGLDAFSEAESVRFFEGALKIEADEGVPIAHETHRGRILYNPWITRRLLSQFEGLRLCCDFSHWVCVCERLIDDQIEVLRQCAARCLHLHARVGYEQGPQVPDPRAPEYQRHLEAHEAWWRMIWKAQAERGAVISTLTPEYGPPDYLHTAPFTQTPVANLSEICDWQAHRQLEAFANRTT